jgi:hypothetical protein
MIQSSLERLKTHYLQKKTKNIQHESWLKIRSRCDVRQFFLRQLFWFCSTIEEWVVLATCFRTCHWSKLDELDELVECSTCSLKILPGNSNFRKNWYNLHAVNFYLYNLHKKRIKSTSKSSTKISSINFVLIETFLYTKLLNSFITIFTLIKRDFFQF